MQPYKLIDTHSDTASELLDRNEPLKKNTLQVSLEHLKLYQSYIQFFAAWVSKTEAHPKKRATDIFTNLLTQIEQNNDCISLCKTASDIEHVFASKRIGAVFTIEDGRALEGAIQNVSFFYSLGVRAITLAWNDDNDLTAGADTLSDYGLSAFGKETVREMNRLHMAVDVSHISEKGFWDVLETSSAPVFASHANCKALCNHRRNLTDEQIKALIQKKGLICVNLYPPFIKENETATLDDLANHIAHILSLGGENFIGLGSDFDGISTTVRGINTAADYFRLFEILLRRGISHTQIDKITHQNALNFIKRIENFGE